MSQDEIQLRETELLMLQNLMRGENSGLDYGSFRDDNINTAKYRGTRQESLYGSPVLEPAREDGRITQVRFYVDYDDGAVERSVQVRAHRDGHISTSKATLPDFVNRINKHLGEIERCEEYLEPLDDVIDEFVYKKFRGEIYSGENAYRGSKTRAISRVVGSYFEQYQDEEVHLYEALVANLGIKLSKLDLSDNRYPMVGTPNQYPEKQVDIKEFFEDFAIYGPEDIARPDFDVHWGHMDYILNYECDTPVELINFFEEEYDYR